MEYEAEARAPSHLARGAAAQPLNVSLTDEVMNTVSNATAMAEEIEKRLYALRDRLIGSPPEKVQDSGANTTSPSNFKSAFAVRSSSLIETLAAIDRISMDLANRL